MAGELAGQRKLSEAVSYHFFRHAHFNMSTAIVHAENVADEFRSDLRSTGPGLDDNAAAGLCFAKTFFISFGSTNGPFLSERDMVIYYSYYAS